MTLPAAFRALRASGAPAPAFCRRLTSPPAVPPLSPVAADGAAAAVDAAPGAASNVEPWVRGQPMRLLASILLRQPKLTMRHDDLLDAAFTTGMFKSRRHIKHSLKMMKSVKRVGVSCQGVEHVGSSKRVFHVTLFPKARKLYTSYMKHHQAQGDQTAQQGAPADGAPQGRGLTDAL